MKKFIKRLSLLLLIPILICCNQETNFSGQLDVPNTLFTYSAEGSGIPCIMFTGSENVGQRLLPKQFRENFNLIHADPKNIGEEIIPNITLSDVVDDIEIVRKFLKVKEIMIVGHSMFSPLPLLYAATYPENISYAVSTGGAPSFAAKYLSAGQNYWTETASDERKKILNDNLAKLNGLDKSQYSEGEWFILEYTAYTPYRFEDPEFDMTNLWDGIELNMLFINHYYNNLIQKLEDINIYKNITAPVLAISGKYDFGLPYYLWDPAKTLINDFTVKEFKNAGHNPMVEIPEEFTKTVVDWIESKK